MLDAREEDGGVGVDGRAEGRFSKEQKREAKREGRAARKQTRKRREKEKKRLLQVARTACESNVSAHDKEMVENF